jgi:hypothetical protein
MIESPVLQELIADYRQRDIVKVLVTRFGAEAQALETELKIVDGDQLDDLLERAVTCPDLDSFRKQLPH